MAEITMTVRQILNLGLWNKVCEYKEWSPWSLNEGKIDENELVTFDDLFEKREERDVTTLVALTKTLKGIEEELDDYISNNNSLWAEVALAKIGDVITDLRRAIKD